MTLIEQVRAAIATRDAFDRLGMAGEPVPTTELNAADRACTDADASLDLPAILAALERLERVRPVIAMIELCEGRHGIEGPERIEWAKDKYLTPADIAWAKEKP